jgi:PhzF family phenazine biosynthesis protein
MQFLHLDVFAQADFFGNPLAVVILTGERWPSTEFMQRAANWLNLSETTFACAAADGLNYQVRIFTPMRELPFAGHPSIGTAAALFLSGKLSTEISRYTQHCAAGALPVWRTGEHWFVQAPAVALCELDDAAQQALRTISGVQLLDTAAAPAVLALGPRWAVAEFVSTQALLAAKLDMAALSAWNLAHDNLGLAAFARGYDELGAYLEVRCFVPLDGIAEDPVTGSGNAAIAAFLHARQVFAALPRRYRARQGRALGRDGHLLMEVSENGVVAVGGQVRLIASGDFVAALS